MLTFVALVTDKTVNFRIPLVVFQDFMFFFDKVEYRTVVTQKPKLTIVNKDNDNDHFSTFEAPSECISLSL